MLPRRYKFNPRSLPNFFKDAEVVHSPIFTLFYLKGAQNISAAVIVPKKTESLATGRNKLKRRFIGILSPIIEKHENESFFLAFSLKPQIGKMENDQIMSEVEKALKAVLS